MSDDNDISQPPYVPIEIAVLRDELERERMRLAACSLAAVANTPETAARARVIDKDHPYWSASYGDVCAAVDREMKLREQALTISNMLQHANVGPCTLPEGVNKIIVELDFQKALRRWIRHDQACAELNGPCSCGLDEALGPDNTWVGGIRGQEG